jgi:hypothetical protein
MNFGDKEVWLLQFTSSSRFGNSNLIGKWSGPQANGSPPRPPVRHHDYARLLELAHHLLPTRCFRTMSSELIGRSRTLLQRHLHVVSTIKRPKAATVFPFTTPSLPKAECFAATAILK